MYNYSLETYLLLVDTQCVLVQLPKDMFLQHLVCLVISTNLFYRSSPFSVDDTMAVLVPTIM